MTLADAGGLVGPAGCEQLLLLVMRRVIALLTALSRIPANLGAPTVVRAARQEGRLAGVSLSPVILLWPSGWRLAARLMLSSRLASSCSRFAGLQISLWPF